MREIFIGGFLVVSLASCTFGGDEKTMIFECEQQNAGEACLKLGKRRAGDEAVKYFRMGCEKQSTTACLALAEMTPDKSEANRVLKQACEWKNPTACGKLDASPK